MAKPKQPIRAPVKAAPAPIAPKQVLKPAPIPPPMTQTVRPTMHPQLQGAGLNALQQSGLGRNLQGAEAARLGLGISQPQMLPPNSTQGGQPNLGTQYQPPPSMQSQTTGFNQPSQPRAAPAAPPALGGSGPQGFGISALGGAKPMYKKGGVVKMAKGGKVSAPKVSLASKRGDGIAQRGKTKGRLV